MKNFLGFIIGVILTATVALGVAAYTNADGFSLAQADRHSTQQEVISAVTKEEQVVLLSLAIQGVETTEQSNVELFNRVEVPGTSRSKLVQYEFAAKLGIEGGDVTIEPTQNTQNSEGEGTHYAITIPEFIYIGISDPVFREAAEDNGVLSWVTPEIDDYDITNRILNPESRSEYLSQHRAELESQAQEFYTAIVRGIDPNATVEFTFAR